MISEFLANYSPLQIWAIGILAASLFIQLYFFLWYYSRIIFHRNSKKKISDELPPVSVIIAAKNEEWNIPKYLPLILKQDYPDFQVVVVDDCSEDETWDVLERLKKEYPNLYTTRIHFDPVFKHGKKVALSLGIKAAKNDVLLFTDADCAPNGVNWLKSMVRNYTEGVDIVIGFSPYKKEKGLLNHIIRYDNIFTGVQYLGAALAKRTYMGVGRNLSYKKSLFFNAKGFSPYVQLISGDDDLFINKVAKKNNCAVEISEDSLLNTPAKRTWKDWIIQKRRHISTGKYYKFGDKWRLGLEIGSRFLFYTSFIAALILWPVIWIPLAGFGIRFIIQGLVVNFSAKKLKQPTFLFSFWILDIFMPLFNLWLAIKNARNPKGVKWK